MRYRCFDLGAIPGALRASALERELASWTPYSDTAYYIAWKGPRAQVWCWDAPAVRAILQQAAIKPGRIRILPETVLQSRPANPGLRLLALREGCEGQVWEGETLRHSRWWPHRPNEVEWANFQRDASMPPESRRVEVPAAEPAAECRAPSFKDQGLAGARGGRQYLEQFGLLAVFLAFLVPSAWLGSQWIKLNQGLQVQKSALAEAEKRAAPLRQARAQAQADLGKIRELRDFDPYPSQIELMAAVSRLLPKPNLTVKDWRYQDGKLKLNLALAGAVPANEIITAMQADGSFKNVTAVTDADGKSMALQMEVAIR